MKMKIAKISKRIAIASGNNIELWQPTFSRNSFMDLFVFIVCCQHACMKPFRSKTSVLCTASAYIARNDLVANAFSSGIFAIKVK